MPRLCMLTVPGLQVKSDWAAVHDRLLDDFPHVTDVLATTMTATLLVVYDGEADVDAWLDGVGQAILTRRVRAGARTPVTHRSEGCERERISTSRPESQRLMELIDDSL